MHNFGQSSDNNEPQFSLALNLHLKVTKGKVVIHSRCHIVNRSVVFIFPIHLKLNLPQSTFAILLEPLALATSFFSWKFEAFRLYVTLNHVLFVFLFLVYGN